MHEELLSSKQLLGGGGFIFFAGPIQGQEDLGLTFTETLDFGCYLHIRLFIYSL